MSSTTPGRGPREDAAERPEEARGTDERGTAPAGGASRPGGAESTAVRTSLAQRFAAAKASSSDGGAATAVAPERPVERTTAAPRRPAPGAPPARPAASRPAASRPAEPAVDDVDVDEDVVARSGPRQVRLSVARVDPWSVMKLAFLLSIAVGIGIVVATAAMWYVLDTMHVFADFQALLDDLGAESFINLLEYAQFDRVISMAAIVAVVDVLLLTALATLGAFLYNIVAALVGGLHVTLTDD